MVANQTCYQTIKKRRLTLLNHFCGWRRKYTLPIVYHSNRRAFCSHASALLRQLPKSFFHIVWVEVEIQKAPELTALPQCSSCDHPLVYLQHPATGKLLRGTCKVLGTAHQSPAAEAKNITDQFKSTSRMEHLSTNPQLPKWTRTLEETQSSSVAKFYSKSRYPCHRASR